ncbi:MULTISPECIES: hypothetical protein [Caproicibacterium]|jgi:hypothetical protein|uniref:Uncharacterized protein n=1 Tax=Caproicibacterium lactatifermentans TaxID=2666138 RepID=A0A859DR95_9FIRM|nr:hypothetical protein [Caproicibacterium lactatifermentans]ARP49939.1 hypothetical protein B6259_02975 [Ruminococcaceae bacterium CPB6]MDD4807687.1 hypothetical protein [Oscillospiraceae bacterium]QKN24340.1 hypothetical protein GJQ69_07495 [Caproicibacterium lactatifermentans]QKO30646.1 hypothetical protein GKP14_06310 [Caproicibacterium lactatifermentans]
MTDCLGILTLAAFLVTAAKFLTKRLPLPRLDAAAGKIHVVSSLLLLAFSIAHGICAWHLAGQRPAVSFLLGILLFLCVLATFFSHIFSKKLGNRWLMVHRAATICICVLLVALFLLMWFLP